MSGSSGSSKLEVGSSRLEETHDRPRHRVCEMCSIRKYQVLSPIGTCDACTEKLRAQHEVDLLRHRVVELETENAKLREQGDTNGS